MAVRWTIVIVLVMVAASAGGARADEAPREDTRAAKQAKAYELFKKGRAALEAKHYQEACATFKEAYGYDPDAPGTLLNLGVCFEAQGLFASALKWFRLAQARAHEMNLVEYQQAAEAHTTSLSAKVPTIRIEVRNATRGVVVKIDDEPVDNVGRVEVDAGGHIVVARAPGMKLAKQSPEIVGAGGQTIELVLVPGDDVVVIDRGKRRKQLALVTAIGGGALLATSGLLANYAAHKYHDYASNDPQHPGPFETANAAYQASCPPCDPALYQRAQQLAERANHFRWLAKYPATILFGSGLAAIGLGAALYLTAPSRERVEQTVIVPVVSPDQVGLAASGRF